MIFTLKSSEAGKSSVHYLILSPTSQHFSFRNNKIVVVVLGAKIVSFATSIIVGKLNLTVINRDTATHEENLGNKKHRRRKKTVGPGGMGLGVNFTTGLVVVVVVEAVVLYP